MLNLLNTSKAFFSFDRHLRSIRNLSSIFGYIRDSAPALDAAHLLRAEYALIVSAFDKYLHDLVREKIMSDFFNVALDVTDQLALSLDKLKAITHETDIVKREALLDTYICQNLAKHSFQSPKNVEFAFSLMGIKKVWQELSRQMKMPAESIRDTLALVINRRNKIVHEADFDAVSGSYVVIEQETVSSCREFISILVSAMDVITRRDKGTVLSSCTHRI